MKIPFHQIPLLFLIISGCSEHHYDYAVEQQVLNCFYKHHQDHNINIKQTLDSIEAIYIHYNLLDGKSGESYIKVIEQIRDNNDILVGDQGLIAEIDSFWYIPNSIFCYDSISISIDSVSLENSRLKYVFGVFDSVSIMGDITPARVAEEVLEVFNKRDFENEFYKTLAILLFAQLIKAKSFDHEILRRLPPFPQKDTVEIEAKNIFMILVNGNDELLVQGNPAKTEELKPMIRKFLMETSGKEAVDLPLIGNQLVSKGIVYLNNDLKTSYDFYIHILNEITAAFNDIRMEYSRQFFRMPYDSLDKEKKQIIRDLVPMQISEAEPGI